MASISSQTSNTVNAQSQLLFVSDVIRRAYSRAGITEGEQTPQMLEQAKQNLNLVMKDLLNRGLPLFSIKNYILGFNQGQVQYDLPEAIYDILECSWRTITPLNYQCSGGTDAANLIAANYFAYATTTDFFAASTVISGSPTYLDYQGLFFYGGQTVTLTFYYSTDNVTFIEFDNIETTAYADGQWLWLSYPIGVTGYYFKVTVAEGETLNLRAWYLSNLVTAMDLPISRINRTSWVGYPMKNQTGTPILYYFERTLVPTISIWGSPTQVYNWQLYMKVKYQLQDCGKLTNTLECPPWYLQAVISALAKNLCLEANVKEDMMQRYQILDKESQQDYKAALAANSDYAPLNLATDISCYTK